MVAYVSSYANRAAGTALSVTPSRLSGSASGDIIVAQIVSQGSGMASKAAAQANGFTLIRSDSADQVRCDLYYKVLTSSEPTYWYFYAPTGSTNIAVGLSAYRGGAIDASAGTNSGSSSYSNSQAVVPAANMTGPGVALRLISLDTGYISATPAGTTARYTNSTGTPWVYMYDAAQGSSGSTGTIAVSIGNSATQVVAQTLGIKNPNSAPNAPMLTSPANNATIDRGITQRFAWQFSDPDAGDSQSAYEIRYQRTN